MWGLDEPDNRIVVRVLVETAGTTGGLQVFLRNGGGTAYFWHELAAVEGWQDLVIAPLEADTADGFDPYNGISTIGFQITAGTPPSGTVTADTATAVLQNEPKPSSCGSVTRRSLIAESNKNPTSAASTSSSANTRLPFHSSWSDFRTRSYSARSKRTAPTSPGSHRNSAANC